MKAKTRNLLVASAIAATVGATGASVADMGGFGGDCGQADRMQQGYGGYGTGFGGHGPMHGQGGMHSQGMHGYGMQGGMQGHGMPGYGMHGQGMRGGMGPARDLDLSDEQRDEMAKIRAEFLPQMGELRGKMQANHEQIRALRQGGAMDETAIANLADQKGDLVAEMIKLRARQQARMQALLTDEQREQMRQHRQGTSMGGGMRSTPPSDG